MLPLSPIPRAHLDARPILLFLLCAGSYARDLVSLCKRPSLYIYRYILVDTVFETVHTFWKRYIIIIVCSRKTHLTDIRHWTLRTRMPELNRRTES
jgi:hypothetical protein